MATTGTWSVPGSSSSYVTTGPYLAGAISISTSRASSSDTAVTVSCVVKLGFGTYSSAGISTTGDTFTAVLSEGSTSRASGTISSGTWTRGSGSATQLISGISQTAYPPIKGVSLSYTYSSWTSGSKTFVVDIRRAGSSAKSVSFTLDCPTYSSTQYTLTFKPNGGSGTMSSQSYYYQASGTDNYIILNKNTFTKTGHTFKYWTLGSSDSGSTYVDQSKWYRSNTGNRSLYAQWQPDTYTIKYNGNGNTGGTVPGNQTKTYGVALTLSSSKPTKTGYNFLGWGTQTATTPTWEAGDTLTAEGNRTLYAVWEIITYTIKYDATGGSDAPPDGTKTYGVRYTVGDAPTRVGYRFDGWNTKSDGTGTTYQPGSGYTTNADVTFYALWTKQCKVTKWYISGSNITSSVAYYDAGSNVQLTPVTNTFDVYEPATTVSNNTTYGIWELTTSDPSNTSDFRVTDLCAGVSYVSPYNYTQVSNIQTDYKFKCVYKRRTSTVPVAQFASSAYIRTKKSYSNPLEAFKNILSSSGESGFIAANDDEGTTVCGYVKLNLGYNTSSTVIKKLDRSTVSPIQGIVGGTITMYVLPGQNAYKGAVTSGSDVYLFAWQENTQTDVTYNITTSVSGSTNDYGLAISYFGSDSLQGAYYILDINANGDMVSFGGKSYDKVSTKFDATDVPNYTTNAHKEYGSYGKPAKDGEPSTVLAIYNPLYVEGAEAKLVPALTEGIIEDEVVLSSETLRVWNSLLDSGELPQDINVIPLSVTANGVYTAPLGVAYSPVSVNVPSGGYTPVYQNGILIFN